MPRIILILHAFNNMDEATKVADEINNQGEINFVNAEGANVSVTVGEVQVEGDETTTA